MRLISTPWPFYNRPSIQLGALKAYLQEQHPDVEVHTDHAFLRIAAALDYRLYQEISERTWVAEAVYAALLYPQRFAVIRKFFNRQVESGSRIDQTGFSKITSVIKETTDALIDNIAWHKYRLAGFSVSLCQLTSALYFIKRIKQSYPHLIVAIGGSTFSGTATPQFFDQFAEIDLVINGEGELPLSQLVGYLKASADRAQLPPIAGVVTAGTVNTGGAPTCYQQVKNLSALPYPDYDDYFKALQSLAAPLKFFSTLAVETSRGCWWRRPTADGQSRGCAFCNLNLQWQGYRTKDPDQVVAEIDFLTSRYQTLAVSFVDNVLPKRGSREIFSKLTGLKKDLRMFSEIRATAARPELKLMAHAGMQEVQIGIEALSTSLLAKLNKGTTAIQNLEIMRDCETLGLINYANLILHFPGSDEQDVAETLRSLEFALPYRPLKAVGFWLGLGSPVWQNPEAYGIKAVFNHPNWGVLFPRNITTSLQLMIQAYRGDLGYQRKIWRPVEKALNKWQQSYTNLSRGPNRSASLNFRDGREFLIIRQRKLNAETITHRLVGTSRRIYLYCQQHRSIKDIRDRFPAFAEDKIVGFLKMMVAKKLMFEEKVRYLSLAIPEKRFRPS